MTRAGAIAILVATAAAALPGAAAAQFNVAQPAEYLLTTDAFDGRSVWVQPAGLARHREASLGAHVSASRSSGTSRFSDFGINLASNGLAAGWQRDRLADGRHASTLALGLGLGDARFSAGFARRWHRLAGVNSSGLDIGARYQPSLLLELSAVWRDIGDPVVRDSVHKAVLVPGAAVSLLRGRLRLGAEIDMVTDGWGTSEIRGGATLVLAPTLVLRARGTFAPGFERRELAIAAEWSAPRFRFTGFSSDRSLTNEQRAGVSGAVIAAPPRRRFQRP